MTAALDLLARLEAAGVKLSLSESGEGLRVYGEGRPQPEVMAEVRAQKPALLAYLRGEDVGQPAPFLLRRSRVRIKCARFQTGKPSARKRAGAEVAPALLTRPNGGR